MMSNLYIIFSAMYFCTQLPRFKTRRSFVSLSHVGYAG